jgi:hypothetical protein
MAVVATPSYLEGRTLPETRQDLTEHICINLRLQSYDGNYAGNSSAMATASM